MEIPTGTSLFWSKTSQRIFEMNEFAVLANSAEPHAVEKGWMSHDENIGQQYNVYWGS